jgi:hypothetical protein
VADVANAMREHEYKFSSMILAIVGSDAFQKRRGAGNQP